jgi:putative exporter of polyketide antibiotics
MAAPTAFLSRLIGIYCILIALPMGANKSAFVDMVAALVHSAAVLYLFGLILVAAGLALVLTHNVWSGRAPAIIVTLFGWLTLAKGLLFLFQLPPVAAGIAIWGPVYEQYFYVEVAIVLALGVYLTYAGFRPRRQR